MKEVVVRAEKLSKQYMIGRTFRGKEMLRDRIATGVSEWKNRLFSKAPRMQSLSKEFWALNDVSFEVQRGMVLGIIGRNGAGKSTLLKILSRITEPTTGSAELRGRVASLLEVGTGFHGELTGRENIFLNGAILGMYRDEIARRFDEIVAFAEVEKFIDTPVKHYSSGMQMRLAFAVAAHLNPEILLVDEVLAVGDLAFQSKCLGKMGSVAGQGRTVILVSHNLASIQELCPAVLWLDSGMVKEFGNSVSVISNYLQDTLGTGSTYRIPDHLHRVQSPLQIRALELLNSKAEPANSFLQGEDIRVRLTIEAKQDVLQARVGIGLNAEGIRVFTSHAPPADFRGAPDFYTTDCVLKASVLLPNFYRLQLGIYSSLNGQGLDWIGDAVSFRIEAISVDGFPKYDHRDPGLVRLECHWDSPSLIQKKENHSSAIV